MHVYVYICLHIYMYICMYVIMAPQTVDSIMFDFVYGEVT